MNIECSDFFTVIFLILKITYRDFADFYHRDFFCSRTDGEIDSRRRNEVIIFDSVQSAVGYRL